MIRHARTNCFSWTVRFKFPSVVQVLVRSDGDTGILIYMCVHPQHTSDTRSLYPPSTTRVTPGREEAGTREVTRVHQDPLSLPLWGRLVSGIKGEFRSHPITTHSVWVLTHFERKTPLLDFR